MPENSVIHSFSNPGFSGQGRTFPGFPLKSDIIRERLAPRDAIRLDVRENDLVSLIPLGAEPSACVLVFDAKGQQALEILGLAPGATLPDPDFDSSRILAWIESNGGDAKTALAPATVQVSELLALRAAESCTVWVALPQRTADLISHPSPGAIEVSVKPSRFDLCAQLPPLLGEVRDEFTVDRGTARAYALQPGEFVQIIDVEGQQCSDFIAMRGRSLDAGVEHLIDTTATRSMVRGAYPAPGLFDKFFDGDLRPMMRVLQDTCGRHDAFGMACTARGYADRGFPGHLNCSDNISAALDPYGVSYRSAWPAINFFWNTWIDAQHQQMHTEESYSRPGDYVVMQAMDDLVCVSTACPDDIDPINGWNPTDVHIRIYRPDTGIRRAVAYREKEDATMSISRESAFHAATSKLTNHFAVARDTWLPVSFPAIGTVGEYWACREKVTLQDMSSLRKFDVAGPDAERLLQRALTKDVSRLAVWRGAYALICDEMGSVIDDGTLFRLAPDLFRWCCGSEESARAMRSIAEIEGLQVRIHGMESALPNLALQGPRSRDVLQKLVFTQPSHPALDDLKWFGVTIARIGDRDGVPFMLSRTGYTGELGYELFCATTDAKALWDAVMEAGAEFGIVPMGADALEIIRVEAGLAARTEFANGIDAFEAGLGFAVDLRKSDFIGKTALERNARDPRRVLKGLKFTCSDMPGHAAQVLSGERPVGAVTSATRSPMFECTIAMARLAVEFAENGTELEVGQLDGRMKRLKATVCGIPFFDPKRERARA